MDGFLGKTLDNGLSVVSKPIQHMQWISSTSSCVLKKTSEFTSSLIMVINSLIMKTQLLEIGALSAIPNYQGYRRGGKGERRGD